MKKGAEKEKFRLIDQIVPDEERYGPIYGVLSTTFDLNAEFFETDFLPGLLGHGAWNDRAWASRIAMERTLAYLEKPVTVFMQADRYAGRPRSLRVQLLPCQPSAGRVLHAKVTVIMYASAIRLVVGSANLTADGYRHNREVALSVLATQKDTQHAGLIRAALADMPRMLGEAWKEEPDAFRTDAIRLLDSWGAQISDHVQFVWGGGAVPLHRQFLSQWPAGEHIERITIVSPFWSATIKDGPIGRFVEALRSRRAVDMDTELRLVSQARPHPDDQWVPEFPEGYGSFDFSQLGLTAWGHAADPSIPPEDAGMRTDFTGTRRLHAKVVLAEGESTALAYLGSANFTARGWGFTASAEAANIEAGIILRGKADGVEFLRALIPPFAGRSIRLNGAAPVAVTPEQGEADSPRPWPAFIQEVTLALSAPESEELELRIYIDPSEAAGAWQIETMGDSPQVLADSVNYGGGIDCLHIPLDPSRLVALLRSGEVLVTWWAATEPRPYPINVEPEARDQLPVAPGEAHAGEQMLLAYYQGRIAFEDLFPPPPDWLPDPADEAVQNETLPLNGVDTSGIQSYQIREFVESLQGIRDDLKQAAISEPAIRWALCGRVSPVALAREIHNAVVTNRRTAAGGAFELVELISCLEEARDYEVAETLNRAWQKTITLAITKINGWLEELKADYPKYLGPTFRRYERALTKHHRDGGARP